MQLGLRAGSLLALITFTQMIRVASFYRFAVDNRTIRIIIRIALVVTLAMLLCLINCRFIIIIIIIIIMHIIMIDTHPTKS